MPLDTPRESAKLINALVAARPASPDGSPVPPIGATVSGGVLVTADPAGRDWLLGVLKAIAPSPPVSSGK